MRSAIEGRIKRAALTDGVFPKVRVLKEGLRLRLQTPFFHAGRLALICAHATVNVWNGIDVRILGDKK